MLISIFLMPLETDPPKLTSFAQPSLLPLLELCLAVLFRYHVFGLDLLPLP